jgi:hypothetical protein
MREEAWHAFHYKMLSPNPIPPNILLFDAEESRVVAIILRILLCTREEQVDPKWLVTERGVEMDIRLIQRLQHERTPYPILYTIVHSQQIDRVSRLESPRCVFYGQLVTVPKTV